MNNNITESRLKKYFETTEKALELAEESKNITGMRKERDDFIDMIKRYIEDARHFEKKGDIVTAFAALNYAHGWLDAGARIGLFDVHDNKYFAVD